MNDDVSASRLIPPLSNIEGAIARDCLGLWNERLIKSRVVSFQSPAGYGKTTAALQLLAPRRQNIRWLTIAAPNTNRVSFWNSIIQLFADEIGSMKNSLSTQFSAAAEKAEAAVVGLCNALSAIEGTLDLVLDDYHLLRGSANSEMELFLDNAPHAVRIWFLSRGHEDLALSRFASRGELFELDAQDLLFDSRESVSLLRSVNSGLTEEDCVKIDSQVGGWAAGLRTIATLLSDLPDPGLLVKNLLKRKKRIASYLAADVMDSLEPDLQSLVQHTVFLETITGAAASRLLSDRSEMWCDAKLQVLSERGFLLENIGSKGYRYQTFFRDLMKQYIINHGEDFSDLVVSSAELMVEEGCIEEAVSILFENGAAEYLTQVLSEHYGLWINSGRYAEFIAMLESLDTNLRKNSPPLEGLYIWARTLLRQEIAHEDFNCDILNSREDQGLCAAAKCYSAFYILGDSIELSRAYEQSASLLQNHFSGIMSILSFLKNSADHWTGNVETAHSAFSRLDRESLYQIAPYIGVLLDINLALVHCDMLQVKESLALYTDTRRRLESIYNLHDPPFWDLAWVHDALLRSWNKCDVDLVHEIKKAVLVTEDFRSNEIVYLCHRFAAEALVPLSIEDAYFHIDRSLYHVGKSKWGRKIVLAEAAKLACWCDSADESKRWAVQMDAVEHRGNLGRHLLDSTSCWLAWQNGDTDTAGALVSRMLQSNKVPPLLKLELSILKARINDDGVLLKGLVNDCRDRGLGAWAAIRAGMHGLSQKSANGSDTVPDPQKQTDYILNTLNDEEIRQLVDQKKTVKIRGYKEQFNGRELQILHLMARGASNTEIAETIYISINTVRWYARQLFAKLDVRRRGEAASAARKLGLLN